MLDQNEVNENEELYFSARDVSLYQLDHKKRQHVSNVKQGPNEILCRFETNL